MDEPIECGNNIKESFLINIQFLQNASWQGTITWIEQKKTQCFRSTLEMIKLMESAIAQENNTGIEEWK